MRPLVAPRLHGVNFRDLETVVSFEELAAIHDLLDALDSAEALSRARR